MTYEEFVNQPLILRRKIKHKIEDVALKESACMQNTSQLKERVQSSVDNSTERSYVRYIDAKNQLDDMFSDLEIIQDEVRDFLYGNLSPEDADILEWKYIDGKRPRDIAYEVGMNNDAMRQKIKRADAKARTKYARKEI